MIYPNAEVIINNNSYMFTNTKMIRRGRKDLPNDFVFGQTKKNFAFIILSQVITDTKLICKFLKRHNIFNATFIIDDVFRLNYKGAPHLISPNIIETDFDNVVFLELELIKNIIKKVGINKYKIFHCEIIPKNISKKIGLKINYYDKFLYEWLIMNEKKITNISHHVDFNYKVSSLSNRFDYHRAAITALFFDHPDFSYTFCEKIHPKTFFDNNSFNLSELEKYTNNNIVEKCKDFIDKPCKLLDKNYYYSNSEGCILPGNIQNQADVYQHIQDSFLHVVNETRFESPMKYISEKTFKPIISKRPFIILGPPGSLQVLKKWGFKTFDQFFDESYDLETNHYKRFSMVANVINSVLDSNAYTLKSQLVYEMRDILDHNLNVLKYFNQDFYLKS